MKYIKYFFGMGALFLFLACGSAKAVKESAVANKNMTTKNIVAAHNASIQDFNTLAARVQVQFKNDKQSQSITTSVRIEKDKTIWIKASILGITLAKVLITPEKVSFYESIDQSYFEGDFRLLSDFLGTEINFKQAQAILLGNSIFNLDPANYSTNLATNKYQLIPKRQDPQMLLTLLLNPDNFKVHQETVSQPKEGRELSVLYGSYDLIGTDHYPSEINIEALEGDSKTTIDLSYKKIDLNVSVSFPFEIPEGYSEMKID